MDNLINQQLILAMTGSILELTIQMRDIAQQHLNVSYGILEVNTRREEQERILLDKVRELIERIDHNTNEER